MKLYLTRVRAVFLQKGLCAFFITLVLMGIPSIGYSVDVVLNPGHINGQIGFTNTSPLVSSFTMSSCYVFAKNSEPAGLESVTSACTAASPLLKNYDLTVEAGGTGGVLYKSIGGHIGLSKGNQVTGYYYTTRTNTTSVTSASSAPPVTVDLKDCVGVAHVQFGHNNCATPADLVKVDSLILGTPNWTQHTAPTSESYMLATDGTITPITYQFTQGTDYFTDLITVSGKTAPITFQCDVVKEVCIEPIGPTNISQITGAWDIKGEFEAKVGNTFTRITADWGPGGTGRAATLAGSNFTTASSTESNPNWVLQNLPIGSYRLYGRSLLRTGRATNWFTAFLPSVDVPSVSLDMGNTFVMTPDYIYGDVLLADTYTPNHPTAYSGLKTLLFNAAASPSNILPTTFTLFTPNSNIVGTNGANSSYTAWPSNTVIPDKSMGAFDAKLGKFSSNYELVIANANNPSQSRNWRTTNMTLAIQTPADSAHPTARPYPSGLILTNNIAPTFSFVGNGTRFKQDFKYCFGEVVYGSANFRTSTGSDLYDPSATVTGKFVGQNFWKESADYSVKGTFYGTPVGLGNKALQGEVKLTLPEGTDYILTPTVSAVSSTGSTSSVTFNKTKVKTLACGQRLVVGNGLSVSVDINCVKEGTVALKITANTEDGLNNSPIEEIIYKVNGATYTVCSNATGTPCPNTPEVTYDNIVINGITTRTKEIAVYTKSMKSDGTTQTASNISPIPCAIGNELTIDSQPDGGRISDYLINCGTDGLNTGTICHAFYNQNVETKLTATPRYGYSFSGWTGACASQGSANPCRIKMDSAKTVGAIFTPIATYNLTVQKTGNGTVTSIPSGISCGSTCSAAYRKDTTVTLIATPSKNFAGWSGCDSTKISPPTCIVKIGTTDKTVTPTFTP